MKRVDPNQMLQNMPSLLVCIHNFCSKIKKKNTPDTPSMKNGLVQFTRIGESRRHKRVRVDEPPHDKTNKMICAPSKVSDKPGHLPSLTSLCKCAQWVAKDPGFLHADSKDWSESMLGAQIFLLVLSWGGSDGRCLAIKLPIPEKFQHSNKNAVIFLKL